MIRDFWESDIYGRVRILLHDSSDCFDEESTFFPFNRIRISLHPPEPDSLFGNYTDHIRDVIRHGLNRIFIFNQGSKALNFFRKYFGSNAVFFPTIFIPGWALTGVSAFEEIDSDSETRFHSPEFDLILKHIAAGIKFPHLGSLKSRSSVWPGPFAQNIFGAGLIKYISQQKNKNKIKEFVRNYTSHPLPVVFKGLFNLKFLSMSERFRMAFGKSIETVWKELEAESGKEKTGRNNFKSLTNSGFIKKFVLSLPDGSIVFFSENFKSYPGVYMLKRNEKEPTLLFRKRSVKGISYFREENKLYFSAVEKYKKYFNFADIYNFDIDSGKVSRITRGERLTFPVRSGNRIYCIKREGAGSHLAFLNTGVSGVTIISDRFMYLSGLSVSSGSGLIATSVKAAGGNWKIGVFGENGEKKGFVEYGENRAFSPVWKDKDELMFVTSLEKNFGLVSFNINLGEMKIYNSGLLPAFKYFSPEGEDIIVAPVLNGGGYDLVRIDLSRFVPETKIYSFSEDVEYPVRGLSYSPSESGYRSFRDLSPKYFTLSFREGGNELQAGILASGFDSLRHHYFKLVYLAGLNSGRSNYYLNYIYNGMPGELNFKYSKFSDMNRSDERGRFFQLSEKFISSYTYPLSVSSNGELSLYTDIHFEKWKDEFRGSFTDTRFNGIRAGITINSTETYFNSISENDGFNFDAVYSKELESLGSRSNSSSFTLEYSQFIQFPRYNTFALRFAFAESWGEGRRQFYMGGTNAGDERDRFDEKIFGLLRGYPSGYFSGTAGFSLNLEYRFLLRRIERPFFIFKSLESLYASAFLDAGQLWTGKMRYDPVATAGLELNLVLYLGTIKYVVAGGAGYGINPEKDPVFYFRLGTSF
ncbi:MAG: hypothetical protein ABFR36_00835 [Acidobacteriota bacterium]